MPSMFISAFFQMLSELKYQHHTCQRVYWMSLMPLNREIVIVLTFKVCAIALIYVLFFSPSHRARVTPENMATMMVQAGPITTK